MELKVPMGSNVRDVISGFEGIVTGYCRYLTGCDQAGVKPTKLKDDGSTQDVRYFDVTRLKVLKGPTRDIQKILDGKMQDERKSEKTGGPQESPPV